MEILRRCERGQTAVIMTLVMVTLLGAVALGADEAVMYFNWVKLQKAADASALAGAAAALPNDPATASSTATSYAKYNGMTISGDQISATVAPDDKSITVTVQRTVPYAFGTLLGLSSHLVSAQATAAVENASGTCGILPIGLPCNSNVAVTDATQCNGGGYAKYETGGGLYQLKASQIGPGNWEPVALGGDGASIYQTNISSGYSGPAIVPGTPSAWVPTETGNIVGPTRHGFDARMSNADASTWISPPPSVIDNTMWQAVLVPLVNFGSPNGKKQVEIVGFQEMWVTSVDGNNATISAYLINNLPNCGTPTTGTGDGTTTVALIQ